MADLQIPGAPQVCISCVYLHRATFLPLPDVQQFCNRRHKLVATNHSPAYLSKPPSVSVFDEAALLSVNDRVVLFVVCVLLSFVNCRVQSTRCAPLAVLLCVSLWEVRASNVQICLLLLVCVYLDEFACF
jgi:hypothetical protein